MSAPKSSLVLLAGAPPSSLLLQQESSAAGLVYCADGAAEYAREAGIKVDRIIGDLDSITGVTRAYFEARGTTIEHAPDQNSDDFEKSLRSLARLSHARVRVLGIGGRRTDHTLTNFSVMLKCAGLFESIRAVEEDFEHFFLTESNPIYSDDLDNDRIVSLSAFGQAHGIRTANLLYPLNDEDLGLGAREGLSNRVTGSPVTISLRSGVLLVSIQR
jgi:thiamine pyrophosphokinase